MVSYCYNNYGQRYACQSTWSNWGRWVALGVIVIAAIIFFFLISCISQRRRRKAGRQPFYGTGWTNKLPGNGSAPPYNPQQNYQQPPQYNPNTNNNQYSAPQGPPPGGHYGANQSYFGGQRENDVEMQPPQNVYNNNTGSSGYAPPPGPPPAKY